MQTVHWVFAVAMFAAACAAGGAPTAPGSDLLPDAPKTSVAVSGQPAQQSTAAIPSATRALTRVESNKVCMVNNAYMGLDQIPVVVGSKTYFGCCAMCEGKLKRDPSSRTATDPLSGNLVDKADAVIAKTDSNAVLYFENAQNFETYAAQ